MSSVKQSAIWDLQLRQLLLTKLGQEASECEDFIAADPRTCRFAVADGATEAFDARSWAERLAHRWVQRESTLTLEEFIRHDSPHHLQDNDIAPKEFQGTCEGKLGSCGSEGEFCLYIFDVSQCRQPSLVAQMLNLECGRRAGEAKAIAP